MFSETDADKAIRFQNALISLATGGNFDGGSDAYRELREYFGQRADTREKLPDFIRRCADTSQFWGFIKYEKETYRERRELIWSAFRPLITYLEFRDNSPAVDTVTHQVLAFDPNDVTSIWQKALDRRNGDPEGAITAARTLIETVCKYILDDANVGYSDDIDLPKLWNLTAEQMSLAPSQHQEPAFRAILGNLQAVVNGLASLRNKVGDAHGQGRKAVRPRSRHAELAVNLAGAAASFLIATWKEKRGDR
ncbi:hypothetical protein sos41_27260 [Alphaproteobacteria bacterium SO-S41]|nr:hypothetical protein sos41_27260 [Alphaproteobacteria bacterium SO-S41]